MKTMRLTQFFLGGALFVFAFTACNEASEKASDTVSEAVTEVSETAKDMAAPITDAFDTEPATGANYGAGVASDASPVSLSDFVQKLEVADSMEATITATVGEVCQKKGCWMTLEPAEEGQREVTVRFKDYGFFMPKELPGNDVIVQGMAKKVITPVEDLRHYAEDAGKSAEEIAAITEPKEELEFIATGVRVL